MARTSKLIPGAFAGPGAVRQGEALPIYVCNTCHEQVVWCTSKRTGSKYLVTVSTGYLGQRFYQGNRIHKCEAV